MSSRRRRRSLPHALSFQVAEIFALVSWIGYLCRVALHGQRLISSVSGPSTALATLPGKPCLRSLWPIGGGGGGGGSSDAVPD